MPVGSQTLLAPYTPDALMLAAATNLVIAALDLGGRWKARQIAVVKATNPNSLPLAASLIYLNTMQPTIILEAGHATLRGFTNLLRWLFAPYRLPLESYYNWMCG